jgi:Tyrosyl-DNA phosphodiesterase
MEEGRDAHEGGPGRMNAHQPKEEREPLSYHQQLELARAAHRARFAAHTRARAANSGEGEAGRPLKRSRSDEGHPTAATSVPTLIDAAATAAAPTPPTAHPQQQQQVQQRRRDEQAMFEYSVLRDLAVTGLTDLSKRRGAKRFFTSFSGNHVLRNRLLTSQHSATSSNWLLCIEDLVQAVDGAGQRVKLLHAVFTAGMIDQDWILDACDDPELGVTVPVTFVSDAKWGGPETARPHVETVRQFDQQRFRLWHAKVMLLHFADRLRVVVTSANYEPTEVAFQTQQFFVQEFPPRPPQSQQRNAVGQDFFNQLRQFADKTEMAQPRCPWLQHYDFDDAKARLVLSYPGSFSPSSAIQPGWLRLRQLLSSVRSNHCTAQAHSIGSITWTWLRSFLKASNVCGGELPNDNSELENAMAVAFPSTNNRLNMKTSIHLLKKTVYEKTEFPRSVFRNLVPINTRPDYGFHTKIIVWQARDNQRSETVAVYAGSHCFSKAAWGEFNKLNGNCVINNVEAGVVFLGDVARNVARNLHFLIPAPEYDDGDSPVLVHDDATEWSCSSCTFLNPPSASSCEVCHRPSGS